MTTTAVENSIKLVLSQELGLAVENIKDTDKLGKDLDANSLDMLCVQSALEENFGIDISPVDVYRSMTVNDVFNLVSRLLLVKQTPQTA